MAAEEGVDLSKLKSQISESRGIWKLGIVRSQSQVDALQAKLMEVKASTMSFEKDANEELEVLWQRVNTAAALLTYLKSGRRSKVAPDLTPASHGSKQCEEFGISKQLGGVEEDDEAYVDELLKYVHMVTEVMEALVKRVIVAESKTVIEKKKVALGEKEIRQRAAQLENMSTKLEEMERFAMGTNGILNEMRQRVEDLVEETTRQRQRATENEEELSRVKQDFESLKSYVSSLISVKETLLSSEKQFQTIERLFERSVCFLLRS